MPPDGRGRLFRRPTRRPRKRRVHREDRKDRPTRRCIGSILPSRGAKGRPVGRPVVPRGVEEGCGGRPHPPGDRRAHGSAEGEASSTRAVSSTLLTVRRPPPGPADRGRVPPTAAPRRPEPATAASPRFASPGHTGNTAWGRRRTCTGRGRAMRPPGGPGDGVVVGRGHDVWTQVSGRAEHAEIAHAVHPGRLEVDNWAECADDV